MVVEILENVCRGMIHHPAIDVLEGKCVSRVDGGTLNCDGKRKEDGELVLVEGRGDVGCLWRAGVGSGDVFA